MFRLLPLAFAAIAAPALGADEPMSKDELCKWVHTRALSIMTLRQLEMPMPELMAKFDADDELQRRMVVTAYDQPSFSGKSLRIEAARDFANDWAVRCYKGEL